MFTLLVFLFKNRIVQFSYNIYTTKNVYSVTALLVFGIHIQSLLLSIHFKTILLLLVSKE